MCKHVAKPVVRHLPPTNVKGKQMPTKEKNLAPGSQAKWHNKHFICVFVGIKESIVTLIYLSLVNTAQQHSAF